jgi:hypothetical protein
MNGKSASTQIQLKNGDTLAYNPCYKIIDRIYSLVLVKIKNIQLRYTTAWNYGKESIINIANPITDYYNTPSILNDYKYSVYYDDKVLIGTSITLNDLYYEPNINGHRLFANPKYTKYRTYPRGKVYYR